MKVLLAAINAKYIHSNLAIHSIKAYTNMYGYSVETVEYTINQPVDELLGDLYKRQPDVLCFSCYLWNISYVRRLLLELPKILPGVRLWAGGPEVSYDAPHMLEEYTQLEGILCGEGEETFLELMRYFQDEIPDKREIRGIVYREEEGGIVETPKRPAMDLNNIPFAYRNLSEFKNKILYYESSRGCPFSCSYCLSSVDRCLRFRDVSRVREELQFFIDHRVPQVKFVDRTFNCRHDHAMAIWQYLSEHDKGATNFHFEIAADLLTEEELDIISRMRPGLIQLEIGVQSTNARTIKEIHRTMHFDLVQKAVEQIKGKGNVHQHLDLIAGLPWEDKESFRRSFNAVYRLKPEQLQLGFLEVLKGSRMYEKAQEYQLLYQSKPPYEVLSTKWLSYGDILDLKAIEDMVEVYYNSGQFPNTIGLLESAFCDAFSMYEALAIYYTKEGLDGIQHSRLARFEILFDFIREADLDNLESYRQKLLLDLYLRENAKRRPCFARDIQISKEELRDFYEQEAKRFLYLKGYEEYDSRQLRKMTHLERIDGKLLLFDYRNRDPLNRQAKTYEVTYEETNERDS